MRAVVAATLTRELLAEPVLVIANRPCKAIDFANESGIPNVVIPTLGEAAADADGLAAAALREARADWVILSGYLRKLGPKVLGAYPHRILNIHPALLPDFGGPGMYGRRVHEAVIASGVTKSGASVHFVDDEYDHGEVVARETLEIQPGETPQSLEARVMAIEPALFVRTLQQLTKS
jgi:phosphoribosylglycinamide formyltransferase-1